MSNISLFGQIIQNLDRTIFKKLVKEYQTDKHQKGFDSWSHLTSMLFCHFAKSESLRDISNGLRSATGNLNHLGNVHPPSKSNLSYQNQNRNWELLSTSLSSKCWRAPVSYFQEKLEIFINRSGGSRGGG